MQVKVKKEFELHSNHKAHKDDILDLITINTNRTTNELITILEKSGHIFSVWFADEFDANEHLDFNYKENEVCSAERFIAQNEVDKMLAELAKRKDEEVEYWKAKCMKLLDKF